MIKINHTLFHSNLEYPFPILFQKIYHDTRRDAISETPSTRKCILGSGRWGRTNTNANANGKWRVTRHRHLRLINATLAATIQRGGACENAAGSLCPVQATTTETVPLGTTEPWLCPNQSRMFNYACHPPSLSLEINTFDESVNAFHQLSISHLSIDCQINGKKMCVRMNCIRK